MEFIKKAITAVRAWTSSTATDSSFEQAVKLIGVVEAIKLKHETSEVTKKHLKRCDFDQASELFELSGLEILSLERMAVTAKYFSQYSDTLVKAEIGSSIYERMLKKMIANGSLFDWTHNGLELAVKYPSLQPIVIENCIANVEQVSHWCYLLRQSDKLGLTLTEQQSYIRQAIAASNCTKDLSDLAILARDYFSEHLPMLLGAMMKLAASHEDWLLIWQCTEEDSAQRSVAEDAISNNLNQNLELKQLLLTHANFPAEHPLKKQIRSQVLRQSYDFDEMRWSYSHIGFTDDEFRQEYKKSCFHWLEMTTSGGISCTERETGLLKTLR